MRYGRWPGFGVPGCRGIFPPNIENSTFRPCTIERVASADAFAQSVRRPRQHADDPGQVLPGA
jgi:hypothetical protein